MGETAARLESLFVEGRQINLAGSHPCFRVASQAPIKNVPRWDGQRGEDGIIRGFGPASKSAAIFGFDPGVSGMNSNDSCVQR